MANILTNPRVANKMSNLEAKARSGCPIAQDQMFKQAMVFADAMMADAKVGMDEKERKERLR
ncbi:MAG: hypothetical protein ACRC0J_07920 [Shewanella oncorhynchi]